MAERLARLVAIVAIMLATSVPGQASNDQNWAVGRWQAAGIISRNNMEEKFGTDWKSMFLDVMHKTILEITPSAFTTTRNSFFAVVRGYDYGLTAGTRPAADMYLRADVDANRRVSLGRTVQVEDARMLDVLVLNPQRCIAHVSDSPEVAPLETRNTQYAEFKGGCEGLIGLTIYRIDADEIVVEGADALLVVFARVADAAVPRPGSGPSPPPPTGAAE